MREMKEVGRLKGKKRGQIYIRPNDEEVFNLDLRYMNFDRLMTGPDAPVRLHIVAVGPDVLTRVIELSWTEDSRAEVLRA